VISPRCEAILLLVDTSVWIEVFKKPSRFDLRSVVDVDEVVTCLPIIQEVLQGFRDESAFRLAREAMFSFPLIESPLRSEIFEEAAQLYRTARRAGSTIRSGVDCLIAVCALRHGLAVVHADRDFSFLSQVSPLKQISISVV
jgi:predicted nucleic acid-binding protein